MSSANPFPESTAGKLFFVSGLTGGREVFLGQAIDEPFQEHLTLEGKVLSMTPNGRMVVRPFQTTVNFSLTEPDHSVQVISNEAAHREATGLLELAATHVNRTTYPFVYRWVETAVQPSSRAPATVPETGLHQHGSVGADPFFGLYDEFQATAEQFRRVLFRSSRIDSTRELDRVAELEGDLLIEVGKLTNLAGIKLAQLLQGERELASYFEALQTLDVERGPERSSMAGWPFLFERLQVAKGWARRNGKASLVRDLNVIVKDALYGLNEVILEHGNSLDTLITETFAQYGLSYELDDERREARSPASATTPVAGGMILPAGV